jgi:hypothetical protein
MHLVDVRIFYSGGSGLVATVPSSMTQTAGTAAVTVYNPPPGGGVSGAFSVTVSPNNPTPVFELVDANYNLIKFSYYYPTNMDFGNQVLNTTKNYSLWVKDSNNSGYSLSSLSISRESFRQVQRRALHCRMATLAYYHLRLRRRRPER